MELRIFDAEMSLQGIVENQTSLIWTRRYRKPGSFELHAPITPYNLSLLKEGNLVWKKGSLEAGVIEDIRLEESDTTNSMIIKGRFLESYMDRRLIRGTYTYSGTAETAMRKLLAEQTTPIPNVSLGTFNSFEESVQFQVTCKNLLEYIEKLASCSNIGFRFRTDFNQKKIFFETYKGVNRTMSQGVASRVVFSESYNNLNNTIYQYNDQLLKTLAYVGGEGEGSERVYVTVGGGEGLGLREMFVDAKDIRKEELSDSEYRELLIQRGMEKLAENSIAESFECDTGADINFVYKKDYDLGDIVTIKKRAWGITQDQRIEEIQEIYEYGQMVVVPTLGSPLPESVDWS